MSFVPFTPVRKINPWDVPVKAGLRKRGNNAARLVITAKVLEAEKWNWKEGEKLAVLIGQDESHGILRMKPDANGSIQLVIKSLKTASFFDINLGEVEMFIDRKEETKPVNAELLEDGWVEFVLPKWADETSPKAKLASERQAKLAQIKSSEQAAGAEAKERRTRREKDEEKFEQKRQKVSAIDERTKQEFRADFKLTKNEKRLLSALIEFAPKTRSTESIHRHVYFDDIDGGPDLKIIDVFVCKIRKKIEGVGCKIETVWGEGYKLIGSHEGLMASVL